MLINLKASSSIGNYLQPSELLRRMKNHLHVVVALEEVGNFALAKFGVAELSCGGGSAQNELCALL